VTGIYIIPHVVAGWVRFSGIGVLFRVQALPNHHPLIKFPQFLHCFNKFFEVLMSRLKEKNESQTEECDNEQEEFHGDTTDVFFKFPVD
jgi:hypothetical protein